MADKKYMEECYRKSLSPKQIEKAKNSQMISIFLKIKWMWENLKNSIEAARFPEILALAIAVFLISLILLIVLGGHIITVSEPALYGWSLILYFVSGHLAVKLMPSTVACTRTKSKRCSTNDKHSMTKITRYFEDVSVKALVETAEDFGLNLKSAISWLILENQQYMKDEKEKQQKANLMTQIIVAVFTAALSNMVNAIGEGTSEAMKKSITIGSVCIIILGGMLSAYHMKKSMEKSNAEFQIGKNLSEALNYYANSLYKGSSLTII